MVKKDKRDAADVDDAYDTDADAYKQKTFKQNKTMENFSQQFSWMWEFSQMGQLLEPKLFFCEIFGRVFPFMSWCQNIVSCSPQILINRIDI